MGRGEAAQREDEWDVGDEGSKSDELSGKGRGEAARREDGWGVSDEGSRSSELDDKGQGGG